MKSNSKNRLPKFSPLPVSGPPVQTNPLVWDVPRIGLPCWFNAERWFNTRFVTAFMSTGALNEAARDVNGSFTPDRCIEPAQWEIMELRARANPWHPSGRLEKLVIKKWTSGGAAGYPKRFTVLTLKFHGPDEQIECTSAYTITEKTEPAKVTVFQPKYKGPRMANDTKSAVSGNKRRP